MSNTLEYVVSGTSYMRLSNPAVCRDETNTEIVNMLINKLEKVTGIEKVVRD